MANSPSSEPGGDVPLCAGAPLDELLRSLHQLRKSIKDESQIFRKDLPQALIQLKPASDKQKILEVVSCLESNGSDIISRINEEAFCALLHVLLMRDAPSENQSVLHLLLRHVRNLSSEARRSTRNVTTAAARNKIRLMMKTACKMLLSILFDETNAERRVWSGLFFLELIHDNEDCLRDPLKQFYGCGRSLGNIVLNSESYLLRLIAGLLIAQILALPHEKKELATVLWPENGGKLNSTFPAFFDAGSRAISWYVLFMQWISKYDKYDEEKDGRDYYEFDLDSVRVGDEYILPPCKSSNCVFTRKTFTMICFGVEGTCDRIDFIDIKMSEIRSVEDTLGILTLTLAENSTVHIHGRMINIRSLSVDLSCGRDAELAKKHIRNFLRPTYNRRKRQSREDHVDNQLIRRHMSVAMIDLSIYGDVDNEDTGEAERWGLPSPGHNKESEMACTRPKSQLQSRRGKHQTYAYVELPSENEVIELSELFLQTPPSTEVVPDSNPVQMLDGETINLQADNGNQTVTTDEEMATTRHLDQNPNTHIQNIQSISKECPTLDGAPTPERVEDATNEAEGVLTQALDDHKQDLHEEVSTKSIQDLKSTSSSSTEIPNAQCGGDKEVDATIGASPKRVSEEVERRDNLNVTSSSHHPSCFPETTERCVSACDDANNSLVESQITSCAGFVDSVNLSSDTQGQGVKERRRRTSARIAQLKKSQNHQPTKIVVLKYNPKSAFLNIANEHCSTPEPITMSPATSTLKRPSASKLNRPSQKCREPTNWDLECDDVAKENQTQSAAVKSKAKNTSARPPLSVAQGSRINAGNPSQHTPAVSKGNNRKGAAKLGPPGLPTPGNTKSSQSAKKPRVSATLINQKQTATKSVKQKINPLEAKTTSPEATTRLRPRRGAAKRAEDKIAQTKAYETAAYDVLDPIESSYPADTSFHPESVQTSLLASSSKPSGIGKSDGATKSGNRSIPQLDLLPSKDQDTTATTKTKGKTVGTSQSQSDKSSKLKRPTQTTKEKIQRLSKESSSIATSEKSSSIVSIESSTPVVAEKLRMAIPAATKLQGTLSSKAEKSVSTKTTAVDGTTAVAQPTAATSAKPNKPTSNAKQSFGNILAAKLTKAGIFNKSSPAAQNAQSAQKPAYGTSAISQNVSQFMSRKVDQNELRASVKSPENSVKTNDAPQAVQDAGDTRSIYDLDDESDASNEPLAKPSTLKKENKASCQKMGDPISKFLSNEKIQKKVQVVAFDTAGPKNQGTVSAKKPPQIRGDVQQSKDKTVPLNGAAPEEKTNNGKPAAPKVTQVKPFPQSQVDENGSPLPLRPNNRQGTEFTSNWDLCSSEHSDYDSEASTYIQQNPLRKPSERKGDTPLPKRIKLVDSDESICSESDDETWHMGSTYDPNAPWLRRECSFHSSQSVWTDSTASSVYKAHIPPGEYFLNRRGEWREKRPAKGSTSMTKPENIEKLFPKKPQSEEGLDSLTDSELYYTEEDQSITLVEPDSHLNTPEVQAKWQKALRASNQTTLDILFDISKRLVQHMINEEEAINNILVTYSTGCTRMIEQLAQTHQNFLKEYSASAKPALAKLSARLNEMTQVVQSDQRTITTERTNVKGLKSALGKRKRLFERIDEAAARYQVVA